MLGSTNTFKFGIRRRVDRMHPWKDERCEVTGGKEKGSLGKGFLCL